MAGLYGGSDLATAQDDLVAALHAAAAEVEDRHGVSVELVTVGTCRLDERARAVAGAASEALTNAAKHAGVTRVSVFIEVADGQVVVVVRDRGYGRPGRRRQARRRPRHPDSILGRMRRQGGQASIRTAPGAGTEVEQHAGDPDVTGSRKGGSGPGRRRPLAVPLRGARRDRTGRGSGR